MRVFVGALMAALGNAAVRIFLIVLLAALVFTGLFLLASRSIVTVPVT